MRLAMSPSILVQFGILYVPVILIWCTSAVEGEVWRTATACYGADQRCSSYKLECKQDEKIVLGDLKYGTKTSTVATKCLYGVSDCSTQEKTCCMYNSLDQFTDFGVANRTTIKENCEGKVSCVGWAPRLFYHPYSSYVWIKYACVVDNKNVVKMCSDNRITGNEVFLSYKKSLFEISNSTSPTDCTCMVTQRYCHTYLDVTVVEMDFYRPGTKQSNCSNAVLSDAVIGTSMRCLLAGNVGTMNKYTVIGKGDVVSIRGLYRDDKQDRPSNIVLYYSASQPFTVECYQPGSVISPVNQCSTTNAPTKPSTQSTLTQTRTTKIKQSPTVKASSVSSTRESTSPQTTTTKPGVSSVDNKSSLSQSASTTFSTNSATRSSSKTEPKVSTPSKLTSSIFTSSTLSTKPKLSSVSSFQTSDKTRQTTITIKSSSTVASAHVDLTSFKTTKRGETVSINPLSTTLRSISVNATKSTSNTGSKNGSSSLPTTQLPSKSSSVSESNQNSHRASGPTLKQFSPDKTSSRTSTVSTRSSLKSSSHVNTVNINTAIDSSHSTVSAVTASISSSTSHTVSGNASYSIGTNITATASGMPTRSSAASVTTIGVPKDNNDDGGGNKGLIIGLAVAAVLLVAIIALVLVMCLCFRLKRNEKERRNYIQNTNIFYSFPEDPEDSASTEFESQNTDLTKSDTLPQHFTNPGFKRNGNMADASNSTIRLDDYKIQASRESDANANIVGGVPGNPLGNGTNGRGYTADMPNETVNYVNSTESDDMYATMSIGTDRNTNGGKSVSFDTSATYANEKPEGRTKF